MAKTGSIELAMNILRAKGLDHIAAMAEEEFTAIEKENAEKNEALEKLADADNWWRGYKVDDAEYPNGVTIWRGNGEPDEIAEAVLSSEPT